MRKQIVHVNDKIQILKNKIGDKILPISPKTEFLVKKVINNRDVKGSYQDIYIDLDGEFHFSSRDVLFKTLIPEEEITNRFKEIPWPEAIFYILSEIYGIVSFFTYLSERFSKEDISKMCNDCKVLFLRLKDITKTQMLDYNDLIILLNYKESSDHFTTSHTIDKHLFHIIELSQEMGIYLKEHQNFKKNEEKEKGDEIIDLHDEERDIMNSFRDGNQDLFGY